MGADTEGRHVGLGAGDVRQREFGARKRRGLKEEKVEKRKEGIFWIPERVHDGEGLGAAV